MRKIGVVLEGAGLNFSHLKEELIAREGQDFEALVLVL